ncbi:hypothetical protein Prudu_015582 [Prunus dulcis]|uniref:Uncharacterized protein n=1 Tax=Prunus dulcis TaxID=3755 RepID=A0A4Y1RKM8_PRUDU|nr:hypothetical protein Prudu_015582 [Prunus dulcis]
MALEPASSYNIISSCCLVILSPHTPARIALVRRISRRKSCIYVSASIFRALGFVTLFTPLVWKKNCQILPLTDSSEVAKTKSHVPVIMGSGVYGSKIVLAGGIRPEFDGLANFIPRPCREVYAFDTAIMNSHPPDMIQCRGPLQHGKTHPSSGVRDVRPKYDTWVTLPEPPFFHRRYLGHHTILLFIYRFDMADTSQIWKEHSFTNCTALPYRWDEKKLSYDPHEIKDNRCCDDYDCNNSNVYDYPPYRHQLVPDRHFEWHGTSLPAYIMSKDFTSLTPIQPLRLPDDLLPTQPGCERLRDLYTAKPREIDYRIVHLGGQEICLVLSIDTGFEPNGGVLRKMPIFVASFEFQLSDSKDLLTIKTGSCSVQCFLLGACSSSATKLSMCGAFWLIASPELEGQIDHLSGDAGFELLEELNTHQVQNMAFTAVELRKKLHGNNFTLDTVEAVINDFISRYLQYAHKVDTNPCAAVMLWNSLLEKAKEQLEEPCETAFLAGGDAKIDCNPPPFNNSGSPLAVSTCRISVSIATTSFIIIG